MTLSEVRVCAIPKKDRRSDHELERRGQMARDYLIVLARWNAVGLNWNKNDRLRWKEIAIALAGF